MSIARRTLLTGLLALAAHVVIRTPGLLMPVRRVVWPDGVDYPPYPGDDYCNAVGMDLYGPPVFFMRTGFELRSDAVSQVAYDDAWQSFYGVYAGAA